VITIGACGLLNSIKLALEIVRAARAAVRRRAFSFSMRTAITT